MSFLFDTNVLSELRKKQRQSPNVAAFAEAIGWKSIFTSWVVMAELRRGARLVRRRDPRQATALDAWNAELLEQISDRILPVNNAVADAWATLMVPNPRSLLDALIAATALANGLTLVTRNIRDFDGAGIQLLDPWGV